MPPNADDPVIQLHALTRRFGRLTAVQDVSFDVHRGEIFGLLGPNGSGKSTIIRMLCGVLEPSSGNASVLGFDIVRDAEAIKRRIGYMSQKFSLYADLSVRENLEFYGRIYQLSPERLEQRKKDVLALTGFETRDQNQLAGTLSGGWKQRLALACALIHEPEVIFLDEPTAGIDPVARRQLWDLLFELSHRGVTLFVTTHYMDEAERCTSMGYIYQSKLLVCGKPDDLKAMPEVTPAGTRRWEVDGETAPGGPVATLSRLRGTAGMHDATLFGQTVHVLADDSLSADALATRAGVNTEHLRPITPSLEDVFVTLTAHASKLAADAETGRREDAAGMPPPGIAASQRPRVAASKAASKSPRRPQLLAGFMAIVTKEFSHIRRQPSTLFFMLLIPLIQTLIFGFALDTQIEHIPTVVMNLDGRSESRQFVEQLTNTRIFDVVERVTDEESFHRALAAGRARVGIIMPPDYTEQLLGGRQTYVQVQIDGSDSQVATTALNAVNLMGIRKSIAIGLVKAQALQSGPSRNAAGEIALPIEVRPRLLYNPDLESASFFVPGLVGIILQLVTVFLTSFAIVREREMGTLEQLFVTPVSRSGLLVGKLTPYAIVGFVETLVILTAMVFVFKVPIAGSLALLLALSALFLVCTLSMGLLISTIAKSQVSAVQFAFIIMLPSVLLSGFMFPRAQMPLPIYLISFGLPVTYFIEILRGIILRGADAFDLFPFIVGLTTCGIVLFTLSVTRFRKTLA